MSYKHRNAFIPGLMAPPMGECARSQDIFEFSLITESHSHSRNMDACFVVEKKAVVEINPRLYSGPFITVDATWVQTKSGRILFTTGKLLNSPFSGFSPSFVIEITLFGHFEALWVLFFPPYLQTRQARVAGTSTYLTTSASTAKAHLICKSTLLK